ncbi:hypothetical protein GCM10020331_076560 [Ectobacillus funiculus]
MQHITDYHKIVDGKVLISDVNDLFGLHIDDEDVDTIGGWVMTQNHEIQPGQILEEGGYEFKVLAKDAHQIKRIEIRRQDIEEQAVTV